MAKKGLMTDYARAKRANQQTQQIEQGSVAFNDVVDYVRGMQNNRLTLFELKKQIRAKFLGKEPLQTMQMLIDNKVVELVGDNNGKPVQAHDCIFRQFKICR